MKEVLAAASSPDGRQEMSMEKKYLNTTAWNTFHGEAFMSVSVRWRLEDFHQGYADRVAKAGILVSRYFFPPFSSFGK